MIISVDELRAIPAPERTTTWNPIPHYEVLDQVNKVFTDLGITVLDTRIDVNRLGNNAFVTHRMDKKSNDERFLQLGWRNSTNKTFSIGFTSGTHVIVCSNLVFSGQWMEFRKHTGNLNNDMVRQMALKGTRTTLLNSQKLALWHDEMKEIKRDRKDADHIFMEMVRKGVVAGRNILDLSNAYDEEVKRYGESLYTIYNCATQTFRNMSLPAIATRSEMLNRLMEDNMTENPILDLNALAA